MSKPAKDGSVESARYLAERLRHHEHDGWAEYADALAARLAEAERERDENEGALKVWRRRCGKAEARLSEAERVLGIAAEAIEERCSGLAGDPLQPVADLIGDYYRDTRATDSADAAQGDDK